MNNLQIQALEEEQESLVKRLAEIRRLLPPFNQRSGPYLIAEVYALTLQEAANLYGVEPATVKSWINREHISSIQVFQKGGYQTRIHPGEVEIYLNNRKAQSAH
jgi:hypothetical protein